MSSRLAELALRSWAIPALVVALAALQLYAFHWGVITPDTVVQYGQALSGRYEDWHPPVTAWLWRQLLCVHSGSAPVLVFDVLLYWSGFCLWAEAYRRQGNAIAALAVTVCGVLPIPFGQMGAILKDALLAASCLSASGILALHTLGKRRWTVVSRFACASLLVLATATRFNAVFATLPLLLAALPPPFLVSTRRVILATAIAGLLLVGSSTAINGLLLQPVRTYPFLSLVVFDLGGIGHEVGDNVFPQLDRATGRALDRCYTPSIYNPHDTPECGAVEDRLREEVRAGTRDATRVWLGAIITHPLAYLKHRAEHLNRNWRWLVPNVPRDAVYVMSEDNDLGLHFAENVMTRVVFAAATAMATSPFGRPATWIAVALGLLVLAPRLRSRRLVTLLALSSLGYGGAYAVVSVAPDLRYNLWTMLAAIVAAVLAAAEASTADVSGRRVVIAAVPAAAVALAELGWLIFALPAP